MKTVKTVVRLVRSKTEKQEMYITVDLPESCEVLDDTYEQLYEWAQENGGWRELSGSDAEWQRESSEEEEFDLNNPDVFLRKTENGTLVITDDIEEEKEASRTSAKKKK